MKTKLLFYCFTAACLSMVACKKDHEQTKPVNLTLQLGVDEEEIYFEIPFEQAEVTLTNTINNESYTSRADQTGKVLFENLVQGTYNLNVALTLDAETYSELSGMHSDLPFSLNYTSDNLAIMDNKNLDVTLLTGTPLGNWVIKQIYYAGSDTRDGAAFRDQFIEVYNNSNEVLYADSLCIAIAYGTLRNESSSYTLANNQYDWSQSIGMAAQGDANEDYFYAKAIFMIPSDGTGKKYPVEPGESVVIAQSALDHTQPYSLNSGRDQLIGDANLTIDLSAAQFEAHLYAYEQSIEPGRTMYTFDVDNPAVTDIEVFMANSMRDMMFAPQGRDSFVIFKVPAGVKVEEFPAYAVPTEREVSDETTKYPQVPITYVLDAVETEAPIQADKLPRRLPLSMDVSAISVNGGPYSSESVVRKTQKIVNGRRILMDTNNSAVDFGVLQKADPSQSESSFID